MVALTPGTSTDGFVEYGPLFYILNGISAMLSIIGSIAVIVTFIMFPQLRRFFSRLIVYLAISDLWLCTSMLMGQSRAPHYTKCMVQSCLGVFFGLASIIWTVIIADCLRRVLIVRDLSFESKLEGRLHIITWGVSFLATVAALSAGVLGPAGMICWIRNTAGGILMRLATFYLPLWLGVGYCLWIYWQVSSLLLEVQDTQNSTDTNGHSPSGSRPQDLERQRWYLRSFFILPLILVFCWMPSTLRRLADIFFPDIGWTPLDYLCVLAGPLQGALNAVVYGATPAVRDAWLGRLGNTARTLRGLQVRVQSARRNRHSFQHLDESAEHGLGGVHKATLSTPNGASSPEPTCLGLPATEVLSEDASDLQEQDAVRP